MIRCSSRAVRSAVVVGALVAFGAVCAAEELKPQSRQDLATAMEDEAVSTLKYRLFAEHARKQGKKELADLLESAANAEYTHFLRWAEAAGLVREDWQNITDAIVSEFSKDAGLYKRLAERAEAVGDKELAKSFREVQAQEEHHQQEFIKAITRSLKRD